MPALLELLSRLAAAILLVIGGINLASAWADGDTTIRHLDMSSEVVWTQTPVVVDRSSQTYERVAPVTDPYPMKLRTAGRLRVIDNTTFRYGGADFRLAGVAPIERGKVCMTSAGQRQACGLKAFKALDNVLRNQRVECRIVGGAASEHEVECVVDGSDLRDMLHAELAG
ncbi:thermonuclease family protein [Rhizobium sp. S153]|uniref:Thermonuclease family protein n=1 Tax=Ciceribacter sichuanensis TaxID=2949647 RepID=A0ABT0V7I0_9HYPH|nr:thermonuclease family protein [Ciceribacter sp. S153]MCM2401618.1 thermonuclease family protein [Ciceribacter sp. S153]